MCGCTGRPPCHATFVMKTAAIKCYIIWDALYLDLPGKIPNIEPDQIQGVLHVM